MNVDEMHIGVNLGVQKVGSHSFDNLLPKEIDYYLNKAVDYFIKNNFDPDLSITGKGFEQSTSKIEDLRALIVHKELETEKVSQEFNNLIADKAELPDNLFFIISTGLQISYNTNGISYTLGGPSGNKRIPDGVENEDYKTTQTYGKFVQHDDIYSVLDDPFNHPDINSGLITIENDSIYSYTNSNFITDKVILTYIRQPQRVDKTNSTDCDLSANVHEDIVDIAVDLILNDLERRQQQNTSLEQ